MDIKKKVGQAIKQARQKAGVSQEELAMRIEADQAYVSRIEAGQMNITLETLDMISNALGIEPAELLVLNKDS